MVGTGDLNGDGKADILLQNDNGIVGDILMNGNAVASVNVLATLPAGWEVGGVAKGSIVLHNDNGSDVLWKTNGTAITSVKSLIAPGAAWTGVVTGVDFNGDGTDDFAVQSTDGTVAGFTLNSFSGAITGGATLAQSPGAAWHAIGNEPMMFIDGSGSYANLAATVARDDFNFKNYGTGLDTISGFNPAQDLISFGATTFANYAAMQQHEVAYQGGTLIALGANTVVVIQGVTPGQLGSSNFTFV